MVIVLRQSVVDLSFWGGVKLNLKKRSAKQTLLLELVKIPAHTTETIQ